MAGGVRGLFTGLSDAASDKDALGILPVVRGSARYVLHAEAESTSFAIYGQWGQGKSTFMRLMETEMLKIAATGAEYSNDDVQKLMAHVDDGEKLKREKAKLKLQRAAKSKLICAWFNAWQYMNEEQIWAGVVVELIKAVEAMLPAGQQRLLAWRYNLKMHGTRVLTQLVLPVLLWLVVVLGLTIFGITQLQACLNCCNCSNRSAYTCVSSLAMGNMAFNTTQAGNSSVATAANSTSPAGSSTCQPQLGNGLSVLVGVIGSLLVLLVAWNRVHSVIKPLSETLQDKLKYISMPDHSGKLGYQNEVIEDIKCLKQLLHLQQPGILAFLALLCSTVGHLVACLQCCFCARPLLPFYGSGTCSEVPSTLNGPKLVVFIDDLDRVPPLKVVDVLAAVNLVLSASNITTVIGADKAIIQNALKAYYKDSKHLQGSSLFLEKIVQVSITLTSPDPGAARQFLEHTGVQNTVLRSVLPSWAIAHASAPPQPQCYTSFEQLALRDVLSDSRIAGMTARQVKSFLNHHLLARCILEEVRREKCLQEQAKQLLLHYMPKQRCQQQGLQQRWDTEQQLMQLQQVLQLDARLHDVTTYNRLVNWVFLYSKHPLGMISAVKYLKIQNSNPTRRFQPFGMERSDDTCCMNATLQALLGLAPFCSLLKELAAALEAGLLGSRYPALQGLASLARAALVAQPNEVVAGDPFTEAIRLLRQAVNTDGIVTTQGCDAPAFLDELLRVVSDELRTTQQAGISLNSQPLTSAFDGIKTSLTGMTEQFNVLDLVLSDRSLIGAMEATYGKASTDPVGSLGSTHTGAPAVDSVQGPQRYSISKLPQVLALHLQDGLTAGQLQAVAALDIPKACLSSDCDDGEPGGASYQLTAMVVHCWTLQAGEYDIALVLQEDSTWLYFEDEKQPIEVLLQDINVPYSRVHLLMYCKSRTMGPAVAPAAGLRKPGSIKRLGSSASTLINSQQRESPLARLASFGLDIGIGSPIASTIASPTGSPVGSPIASPLVSPIASPTRDLRIQLSAVPESSPEEEEGTSEDANTAVLNSYTHGSHGADDNSHSISAEDTDAGIGSSSQQQLTEAGPTHSSSGTTSGSEGSATQDTRSPDQSLN